MQTRIEELRKQESALIANPALRWIGLTKTTTFSDDVAKSEEWWKVRTWIRGFPVVELPLAEWGAEVDQQCPSCFGVKRVAASEGDRQVCCPTCHGKGSTGRIWQPSPVCERLMREAGVVVWVGDKRAYQGHNGQWFWLHPNATDYPSEEGNSLPDIVWGDPTLSHVVDEEFNHRRAVMFASAELATAALNAALQRLTVRALWPRVAVVQSPA